MDNLQSLITLKIYQDDAYKAKKMDIEAENFRTITMKVLTMQLNSVSIMNLLVYGGAAVGILTALLQYQAGNLSIFGVILFILLSSEFFIPLRLLGSFFHVAMNGKAASDKIFTLLDTPVKQNESAVDFWAKSLVNILTEKEVSGSSYNYHIAFNNERHLYEVVITVRTHGVDTDYFLNFEFVNGSEYNCIVSLGRQLQGLLEKGAYVARGERQQAVSSFEQAIEWLTKESRRGLGSTL